MNEQEKEEEARKAELYYHIIKNHVEQGKPNKFKVVLIVLASLWATIFGPFILFAIENIYTSQKLPIIIRIYASQLQYELITSICTVVLIYWALWRLFHPYRCHCRYFTWSAKSMLTHVEMRHETTNKWVLWRSIHLYRCDCGYFTWSEKNMLDHAKIGHTKNKGDVVV